MYVYANVRAHVPVCVCMCATHSGGGLVFWHPKGGQVRHEIETFWKNLHLQRGYQLVYSPHVAKSDLWVTSGHMEFYRESMFDQMQVGAPCTRHVRNAHTALSPMHARCGAAYIRKWKASSW